MDEGKIRCSVGITAYNEEANIGRLLQAIIDQRLYEVEISEIIVVASGCTDRTEEIVREAMAREPRIQLYVQPQREGKTSAINVFLEHARERICVLESGDTLPREDTIEKMVNMFRNPAVGMTGAQKVAVNTPDHIVGLLSHLRLQMEHQLCLEIPRLGELIAFRKVFDQLPPDVAMDEAFVEAFIIRRGMQVRYAPEAVVYNMGPETVADFVRQRRRNYAGHLYLKEKYGYKVSSLQNTRVVRLALEQVWGAIRLLATLAFLAMLEICSRILGAWDYYVRKKKHVVWDMAWTTKDPGQEPPPQGDYRESRP
ncbi:MAG: glycosyltransferase [Anaerolineae bacterium]|jgi:cellulose synthase/poly-beta-1,6-N-acetylglucosamine synthase-like glycosyltransferase|nr:glycosyltransferase [Anaerolineae bacterium]MDX9829109.1 glycosyltransferase [Anaerolineae bacterium]